MKMGDNNKVVLRGKRKYLNKIINKLDLGYIRAIVIAKSQSNIGQRTSMPLADSSDLGLLD